MASASCGATDVSVCASGVVRRSVSVMMFRYVIGVPNSLPATRATAALRSSSGPSVDIVADVPMQMSLSAKASRTRRTSKATSAPWRPRYVCSSSRIRKRKPLALRMTALSMSFCRVISSSSIMKLVSRMSGGLAAIACRSSSLSWPVYRPNVTGRAEGWAPRNFFSSSNWLLASAFIG